MRLGKTLTRIVADERGMETLQTVMILAVACFILAVVFKITASIQSVAFTSTDELMEFQGSSVSDETAEQLLSDTAVTGDSTAGSNGSDTTGQSDYGNSNSNPSDSSNTGGSNGSGPTHGTQGSGNRSGGSERYSSSLAGQNTQPVSDDTMATNVHRRENDNWPIHMILACAGGILVLCLYCGRQIMKS